MLAAVWNRIGTIAYWLCWPALFVYLRFSNRTRVLIVCNDEVIVVRGWLADQKWYLPGGGLHRREQPLEGAVREVKEELGIEIDKRLIVHLGSAQAHTHGLSFPYEQFVVVLTDKPVIHRQKMEIVAAEWVNINDLNPSNATLAVCETIATWKQYALSDTM